MNNKYNFFGFFAFFIASQAMDKPNGKIVQITPKTSEFSFDVMAVHRSHMFQFERKELAAKSHQRDYSLSQKSPVYFKLMFDKYIVRESVDEVCLLLTRVPELSNGDPLARDLQNVYNGSATGIYYDPIKYRNIPIWSFVNISRSLAEKGGNDLFLVNYQNHWDSTYELPSPRTTTFSSSSGSSGSWSDGIDD